MSVTRDVIMDLVPVYLTGDASADTRALVDEYLATDAELARWVAAQRTDVFVMTDDVPAASLEHRALLRTRRKLGLQRWLFGLSCFFAALTLSVEFRTWQGRVVEFHFLARDYPLEAIVCLAAAVVCWGAYRGVRRRSI